MFKKFRAYLAAQKRRADYLNINDTWYFDIEYHTNFSCYSQHIQFASLRDAEYWYYKTSGVYPVALTDRQGNRIITDWMGMSGAGTIKLWNDMDRSVLDLREERNDLWLPNTNKRTKYKDANAVPFPKK